MSSWVAAVLGLLVGFLAGAVLVSLYWRRQIRELLAKRGRYERRTATVRHPVLIVNKWSGDGKAEQYGLLEAAEQQGLETVVLERGDDLSELAREAVDRGADALGMAGGDGSLGLVAAVAVEQGVPFFCIPVGTRNHFALDLGLNRDDPLTALAALTDGDEVLIDHGLVGERLFLNNVSFGVYAEAVKKPEYRGSKIKTLADTALKAFESDESRPDVRFTMPDGDELDTTAMLLVSNNPYVMSGPPDYGRRDRLDTGVLGVTALGSDPDGSDLQQWETMSYRVDAAGESLAAGVDGESVSLPAPVDLRIQPNALRVLVPRGTRPGFVSRSQHAAVEFFGLAFLASGETAR